MTTPLTSSMARYCRTMAASRNMWSGVMAGLGRLSNSRTSRSQTLPRPGMARTRSAPLTAGTAAPVTLSCCMAMVPPVVMMTTFDMGGSVCLAEKKEKTAGVPPRTAATGDLYPTCEDCSRIWRGKDIGVFPSFTLHLSRAIGTHLHGFAADSAFFQSFFRVAS